MAADGLTRPVDPSFPARTVAEANRLGVPVRLLTPAEKVARDAKLAAAIEADAAAATAALAAEHHDAIARDPTLRSQYEELTGEPLPVWNGIEAEHARLGYGQSLDGDRVDAADLIAADIPPLRWIVPDLIPEGTTALAAPPKVGKSCLIYQAAVEVAIGGELLGRRVAPGSVLYLALEDGPRRGRDRLVAALAGRTMPRGRLEVRWSAPRIGEGLEDEIDTWLAAHPDAAMVAIDTLGRVRPASNGRRNAYEVDVEDLGRLQSRFRNRPLALVIVHHSRKEAGDNFLASVSGTYGLTGSVDTILVVKRKRLEAFGTIVATGRDIAEAEIPVRFDGLLWQSAPATLPEASFERLEVYRTIEASGPIFPAAIAKAIGLERTSVQHMVDKLVAGGAVVRTAGGYTVVPSPSPLYAPSHSDHWGSDRSERGYVGPPKPPIEATEPDAIECRSYQEHRSLHRWSDASGWICDACSAVAYGPFLEDNAWQPEDPDPPSAFDEVMS